MTELQKKLLEIYFHSAQGLMALETLELAFKKGAESYKEALDEMERDKLGLENALAELESDYKTLIDDAIKLDKEQFQQKYAYGKETENAPN